VMLRHLRYPGSVSRGVLRCPAVLMAGWEGATPKIYLEDP